MPSYQYKAYDSSGGKSDGVIEALSSSAAQAALESDALIPYELKEVKKEGHFWKFESNKVSLSDLEFFTSELSLLLATGVRIDRGLDIIKRTKAKPVLAQLLGDISGSLKAGMSLSSACRAHPKVFDALYCNLVEQGEATGDLTSIFEGLALDLKFKRDLRTKIISALTYPLVILFVCLLSIFFIFNVIIPKMADMFSQAQNLPWYTELMLNTSRWMNDNQVLLLLALVSFVGGILYLRKKAVFIVWWQKVLLQLPVTSNAVKTVERIRFNTGLTLMLKAGLAIDKALELATGNVVNKVLRDEIKVAQKKVKRGEQLTPALKQTSIYPDFYISLLEVGEETGNLEKVFEEIAARSKQDFESWTDRMTSLLEPLMILFMGVFVGGVVVIMMLSMMSLNDVGF
ncbi:type II secretion system F family protein [Pseudoalteromonas sp. MMG013]|uniref:type II secretion system F family protein n=1 Tax=Pseudoalteromonas sp. MMG013 TaxID=2822687 RepID=UPI001B38778D|nr:type II secretion system F family protein [Pseudoalteromonas sp. MMG013]MBQ4860830.1 type II secretion system F family protein [Pseudoalteromonas sp. MMG013]